MSGSRHERQQQKRREELERAMDLLESGGPGVRDAEPRGEASLAQPLVQASAIFFHDHADLVRGMAEALDRTGLEEACQAMARHLEQDRDHWLRRLERIEAEPALRAQRAMLDQDYQEVFIAHFHHWGAAGVQGERIAELEAALLLAALRGAERLWVKSGGRPVLPVLVQEALALLWPALYGHARRHAPR
jgi:hypothetical protein